MHRDEVILDNCESQLQRLRLWQGWVAYGMLVFRILGCLSIATLLMWTFIEHEHAMTEQARTVAPQQAEEFLRQIGLTAQGQVLCEHRHDLLAVCDVLCVAATGGVPVKMLCTEARCRLAD